MIRVPGYLCAVHARACCKWMRIALCDVVCERMCVFMVCDDTRVWMPVCLCVDTCMCTCMLTYVIDTKGRLNMYCANVSCAVRALVCSMNVKHARLTKRIPVMPAYMCTRKPVQLVWRACSQTNMHAPTWTYDTNARARYLPELTQTRAQTFENADTHSRIQKAIYRYESMRRYCTVAARYFRLFNATEC